MKVLVVEDNLPVSIVICRIISSMGHEAVHAACGEDALELYPNGQFGLVLMDVEMPGIDGYETTRRIRRLQRHAWIPIIFLSGNIEDSYLATGIEAGGDDYLFKPVKPIVLKAKIHAMARIAQIQDQLETANDNLIQANEELERLSNLDGLTSVCNRRGFDNLYSLEWRRSLREETPISILMIDIDLFKGYNDRFGHLAGDDCLKEVAKALQGQLRRPGDLVARYGGEEFIVMLPNTDLAGASVVCQHVQEGIHRANLPYFDSGVSNHVTISMGLFCSEQFEGKLNVDDQLRAIENADKALYKAKHNGRNQAFIYAPDI